MPQADVFRALSSPVRRQILDGLQQGPKTTSELAGSVRALSRFAVMQHLRVLEDAGLVLVRREGRHRYNFLNTVPLRQMYERWVTRYAGYSAAEMLRVKRLVEMERGAPTTMDDAVHILKIENEVQLAAPPERVFEAITVRFGEWWPHRIRDGGTPILESRVGGRLYEDWGEGAGALYAWVTHLEPPSRLCLRGPWGLNRESEVIIWWHVEPRAGGAVLRRSFRAWGQFSDEMVRSYREGAQAALEGHLKPFVEGRGDGHSA